MAKGQIIEVDPAKLTIAMNVRRDVNLDKDFVASVKQHGVLQPPMVVKNGTGYDVVLGQRRTLAAVQAKLPKIEAYLVDKNEAEAARIVDQLTENEQRQQLSDVERVGGYKELALIGISPADIAKRTSTPRVRVEQALAVADNEIAVDALAVFDITLDQAAEIVEFSDDKTAVKKLTEAAESDPGTFAHVVRDLRDKRRLKDERAQVEADIEAVGAEVLKATDWGHDRVEGWSKLDTLGTVKDSTVFLAREAVPAEMLGGRAVKGWENGVYSYQVQWLVRDGHEFPRKDHRAAEPQTAEDVERQKRWEKEQAERQALQAARTAAREVRVAWIRDDLLQRKALTVVPFVAMALTTVQAGTYYGEVDDQALSMLGIELPDEVEVEDGDEEPEIAALQKRVAEGGAWQVARADSLSGRGRPIPR